MVKRKVIAVVGASRSGNTWLKDIFEKYKKIAGYGASSQDYYRNKNIKFGRLTTGYKENSMGMRGRIKTFDNDLIIYIYLPSGCVVIPELFSLMDEFDVYVVHLIRDGREHVKSVMRRDKNMGSVKNVAKEWVKMIELGVAYRGHEKYMEVKFEDLLKDVEKEVKKICKFAKIKYESDVIIKAGRRKQTYDDWFSDEDKKNILNIITPTLEMLEYGT